MCINCWRKNGAAKIVNEKTIEAARLIDEVYETENGGAGGYAHIVVDDWNVENSNIDFCINECKSDRFDYSEEDRTTTLECLNYLKTLTEEEKYSALAIQSRFIKITT